ncbi:MAG: hypothetical protein IKH77_02430 [Clostridia bacterium]|nr:hypothetical protein [Clostridia bacterium]
MSNDTFVMKQYARKPAFASFLPGIAGEWGIPVWCYYANRGQGVCSFGTSDKDHAIMEFSPAHVAYQTVERTGFRSFVKRRETGADGKQGTWSFVEAFADGSGDMAIRPNGLSLCWENGETRVAVDYFVLPGCQVGALARRVTLTNLGAPAEVDLLDGMPALVPAGVNQDFLKNMTQLCKAWMQAEDAVPDEAEKRWAIYRVRYSMEDSATIHEIRACHFALGLTEAGERLPVTVDPEAVFGYDTALGRPLGFLGEDFDALLERQAVSNLFPCAFFRRRAVLGTGESLTVNELYGGAESRERFVEGLVRRFPLDGAWFAAKRAEADALAERLTAVIAGKTADPVFDAYSRQSYLDNLLRGGEPIRFADGDRQNIFYCYSRKHGDMEREYNYFVMSPEHFSQGNGNFRDVAQNRRCDVRFHPWVGDSGIRLFFSLVQSDGYNPLVIDRMTFHTKEPAELLDYVEKKDREAARELLSGSFTPGQLAMAAEGWALRGLDAPAFVEKVLARAEGEPNASFKEGYWTDHWTYSLDLIESFLAVWPEEKDRLLFGAEDYPWYEIRAAVLPRGQRAERTENGLRQVRFLRERETPHRWMREAHGQGNRAASSLMAKMVLLCAVKYAARDRAGIGIEMEAGKPGWYDALNGLPGIFGSSVADACELKRLIGWTAAALEEKDGEIRLYREMAALLRAMDGRPDWTARMAALEDYRARTADGVDGAQERLSCRAAAAILRSMEADMTEGLARAVALGKGICPAYLIFSPETAEDPADTGRPTPAFLEGPVRWLKLDAPAGEKQAMVQKVKESGLYDEKLRMYKVNESLAGLTFEAGRCKAFTPGWLENESIWLHMEYKYLLELLRSGLYGAYEEALDTALVPFMDPAVYGRSTYENVSFIASGANPTPAIHGRGFVARLSGSTAEFLSMWQEMMFGFSPFSVEAGRLTLRLTPMIPARLIPAEGVVEAVFLGQTLVRFHIPGRESLIPGGYAIEAYSLDGERVAGDTLPETTARAVRDGRVREMDVFIRR